MLLDISNREGMAAIISTMFVDCILSTQVQDHLVHAVFSNVNDNGHIALLAGQSAVFSDVDGGVLCAADLASCSGAAGLSIDVDDYPFLMP